MKLENAMTFFCYEHLPQHLQNISYHFHDLALYMADKVPNNEEFRAGLRKLLEAKDCFVRAMLLDEDITDCL